MTEHPWHTIQGQAPSKSNTYEIVRIGGRPALKKSDAARRYEQSFHIQVGPYKNLGIKGFFELHVRVYFTTMSHDLDNALKAVLDCLQYTKTIQNDNKCTRIIADKFIDRERPRIEFRIVEV